MTASRGTGHAHPIQTGKNKMANRQPQRQTLAAAVFAACLTMSIAAQAQEADADAQPAASEDQPTTLATMTVTAQKREEALQDVPTPVTRSAEHTSELQSLMPNPHPVIS